MEDINVLLDYLYQFAKETNAGKSCYRFAWRDGVVEICFKKPSKKKD